MIEKSWCKNRGYKYQNLSNLIHHRVILIQYTIFKYISVGFAIIFFCIYLFIL